MASERVILHCDMNCFYASCEMAYNPKLQDKPIAVCGDPERRNGIVFVSGQTDGRENWDALVGSSAALPRHNLRSCEL